MSLSRHALLFPSHPSTHPPTPPKQGKSKYVIVLVEPSHSTDNLIEGLKRMRIVPPALAAVVGITVEPPHEAQVCPSILSLYLPLTHPPTHLLTQRLAKKHGLTETCELLSDAERAWMDAHGMPRLSLRSLLFVLDAEKGSVVSVVRDPAPGAVNGLVMEVVGDWRGKAE